MSRYITQEILIGKKNQKKIENSKIVIIGLGAIGSLSAQLLARAGVKNLIIVDRDYIELKNLHRQFFDEEDIGKSKSEITKNNLKKISSKLKIKSFFDNLDNTNINKIIKKPNLVLDCTDNLETRFIINNYCVKNKIPCIYSGAIAEKGYTLTINPKDKGACFECVFQNLTSSQTCENTGVLNTTTSFISSLQINQAIKLMLNEKYDKNLTYFNAKNNEFTKIKINKNKNCKTCNKNYEYLTGKLTTKIIKFCGRDTYLVKRKINYGKLKLKLKKQKIKEFENSFIINNLTIFKNGKIMIKAKNEKEALTKISKYIGN